MKATDQPPTAPPPVLLTARLAFLPAAAASLVLFYGTGARPAPEAGPALAAAEPEAGQVTLYHDDPAHPWNRLHAALLVRTSPDGKTYGQDEPDPFLWPHSKFLLAGEHHKRVLTLLDDFLARDADKLVKDPLKRATFQHDLWAVFDWLADPHAGNYAAERRALRVRLAKVIRRLALSAEEIKKLPDNYAAAAAAKTFPPRHDPDRADRAFLPPDLPAPDGPWVLLGVHMRPAAPAHVHFTRGRSAFFVLLNLPAGRKATLAYLDQLGAFPNALMPEPADRNVAFTRKNLPRLNPELPQFPVGTQVALVREMLLIDDTGTIRPTRLIESVQFRVYRDIPKGDPARPEGFDSIAGKQDFYEFRLSRRDLFAGKSGGLHAVGPQAKEYLLFNAHPDDPFEAAPQHRHEPPQIMDLCSACHGGRHIPNVGPGIHSVLAYRRGFTGDPPAPHLQEYERRAQEEAVIAWKREHSSWGLFQGLTERE
jgi:hypothetical protein